LSILVSVKKEQGESPVFLNVCSFKAYRLNLIAEGCSFFMLT